MNLSKLGCKWVTREIRVDGINIPSNFFRVVVNGSLICFLRLCAHWGVKRLPEVYWFSFVIFQTCWVFKKLAVRGYQLLINFYSCSRDPGKSSQERSRELVLPKMKDSSGCLHLNCIKLHPQANGETVINCLDKQLFITNFTTFHSDAFGFIKLNIEIEIHSWRWIFQYESYGYKINLVFLHSN